MSYYYNDSYINTKELLMNRVFSYSMGMGSQGLSRNTDGHAGDLVHHIEPLSIVMKQRFSTRHWRLAVIFLVYLMISYIICLFMYT